MYKGTWILAWLCSSGAADGEGQCRLLLTLGISECTSWSRLGHHSNPDSLLHGEFFICMKKMKRDIWLRDLEYAQGRQRSNNVY